MSWLPDETLRHLRRIGEQPDLSGTKYEIRESIGRGGMGLVYLAFDRELEREVALKVLSVPDRESQARARMLREARILAKLEHPGIVPVHDVGVLPDGRVFYSMKRVQGERLDLHVEKVASLRERLRVFEKICEAIAFAHAHGVLHRDLKPQNVMVGSFGEVLVLDWGVAKLLQEEPTATAGHGSRPAFSSSAGSRALEARIDEPASDPRYAVPAEGEHRGGPAEPGVVESDEMTTLGPDDTQPGAVLGTPGYMAPEQARGDVGRIDRKTDVYALGAILDFLAPDPPKRLRAIRDRARAAVPESRYATVDDLGDDVARFLDGGAVAAHRESLIERTWRVAGNHRTPILLVLAYLLMRALLLLF